MAVPLPIFYDVPFCHNAYVVNDDDERQKQYDRQTDDTSYPSLDLTVG